MLLLPSRIEVRIIIVTLSIILSIVNGAFCSDVPLKDIVSTLKPTGHFYLGIASHAKLLGTKTEALITREFSYVTPANAFKQSKLHPAPNIWKEEEPNLWVSKSRQHNFIMRLHAPLGPQSSSWAKEIKRTPDELRKNLKEYLVKIYTSYASDPNVHWIDVINEAILRDGSWNIERGENIRGFNPWGQIGIDQTDPICPPLYIKEAFELANKYAPNTKLIINQHGGMEQPLWNKMKKLVLYLRKQGLRVDGIGWQAHVDVGWEKVPGNLAKLASLIDWCHANDLEFHVTENNVWLRKENKGKYSEQAETFAAIGRVLLKKRASGIIGWNLWHLRDNECQNKKWEACVFFNDYTPKPAWLAIRNIFDNQTE